MAKSNCVGIDIGHHCIKATQVERKGGGWTVTKFASIPTPPEVVHEGIVTDPQAMGAALRQLLRESRIQAKAAIIAVSGGSVVVRTVRIPKMPEATLRKSIKYEAGRYVPTNTDESYLEFEIQGMVDESQMDVLMVAAPKDLVETRVAAVQAAGLQVECVDIEPFAAYRALIEADEATDWSTSTFAILDVGAVTTNVSIIKEGEFSMTRSITQGGDMLTNALKSYFKLSDEDAEAGKAVLDLSVLTDETPKENPPLRVVQQHVDDLIREVRRSLNYFQSQQAEGQQSNSVEAVYLTGGGALMPGLATYMGHKLGIRTQNLGVFDNPRFTYAGTEELNNGTELATVVGLAMRAHLKAEAKKAA